MKYRALVLTAIYSYSLCVSPVLGWSLDKDLDRLAVFHFDDQESSAAWGEEMLNLKASYDSGDSTAMDLMKQIFKAWNDAFPSNEGMVASMEQRFPVFRDNAWSVARVNVEHYKGNSDQVAPWWQSLNAFADLSFDQFEALYLLKTEDIAGKKDKDLDEFDPDDLAHPDPDIQRCVDWSKSDQLTPIKSQGRCASCWAFAAIAAVESNYLIENNKTYSSTPVDLSEQQLVNCVTSSLLGTSWSPYQSTGCSTGSSRDAFDFIRRYGVYKEGSFPYVSGASGVPGSCTLDMRRQQEMRLKKPNPGWRFLTPNGDSSAIKSTLMTAVAVNYIRVESPFQLYNGGIYNTACSMQGINHATMMYGYCDNRIDLQQDQALDYYLLKNSWGTSWGENGTMRIAIRPGDGICESQKYIILHTSPYWRFNL